MRTIQSVGVAVLAVLVIAVTLSLTGSFLLAAAFGVACAIGVAAVLLLWQALPPTDE
ncbi:hypothetical protein [Prescottella defluvii]|uniref:hypothetical protein n=1 Tax=Prescottella defluvii TaxID=1323361 RepID=UPI0012E05A31|nr:hypothetical protein [Prescottella defluvii]